MVIFNIGILNECAYNHADSKKAINKFIQMIDNADVKNHNELLELFPKADYVGNNRYVFDLKGNKYRVICVVVYIEGMVVVKFAGTHAEYDKIDAKTV